MKGAVVVNPTRELAGTAGEPARHFTSGQPEQLVILIVAIIFGVCGLFVHFLVLVSIVLMAVLLGIVASEIRSARGRGIVSEVINEVKIVVKDIKTSGQVKNED